MAYVLTLTPLQSDFYHALLAPFDPGELSEVPARGGKGMLTYLDKRALENRLDTVCGPHGWYPTYEATSRGYKCRLFILCPGASALAENPADPARGWQWVAKEDGAGFEEMGHTNKTTGEFEYDVDNDEKSGYTNALRRAAQDAWGIGRYLYRKGVPLWLSPDNQPLRPFPPRRADTPALCSAPVSASPPVQSPAPALTAPLADPPRQEITTRPRDAHAVESPVVPESAKLAKLVGPPIKLPGSGRGAFAWAKQMETTFDTRVMNGMLEDAKKAGASATMSVWSPEQARSICLSAVAYLMTVPTYAGQFDHLRDEVRRHNEAQSQPRSTTPGVNVADLRKTIVAKLKALILHQTGREATIDECRGLFVQIAPQCTNASGHAGEVPESLNGTSDLVWLTNIDKFADDQIAHAATTQTAQPADVPF